MTDEQDTVERAQRGAGEIIRALEAAETRYLGIIMRKQAVIVDLETTVSTFRQELAIARGEIEALDGKVAELNGKLNEYAGWSPHQFLALHSDYRAHQKKYVELDTQWHDSLTRITTLEELIGKLRTAAGALVGAMETCHICKGSIIVEDGPTHCEDCGGDCDDHDEPNCPTICELHEKLGRALAQAKKLLP